MPGVTGGDNMDADYGYPQDGWGGPNDITANELRRRSAELAREESQYINPLDPEALVKYRTLIAKRRAFNEDLNRHLKSREPGYASNVKHTLKQLWREYRTEPDPLIRMLESLRRAAERARSQRCDRYAGEIDAQLGRLGKAALASLYPIPDTGTCSPDLAHRKADIDAALTELLQEWYD